MAIEMNMTNGIGPLTSLAGVGRKHLKKKVAGFNLDIRCRMINGSTLYSYEELTSMLALVVSAGEELNCD